MTYLITARTAGLAGPLDSLSAATAPSRRQAALLVAEATTGPLQTAIRANIASNPSLKTMQQYNLLRFNEPNISDSEKKRRMDAKEYTLLWRAYYELASRPFLAVSGSTQAMLNNALYAEFKRWHDRIKSELAPASVGVAGSAGDGGFSISPMVLAAGGAALIAVIALSRR